MAALNTPFWQNLDLCFEGDTHRNRIDEAMRCHGSHASTDSATLARSFEKYIKTAYGDPFGQIVARLVSSVLRDSYFPRTDSRVDTQSPVCPKTQAVSGSTENPRAFRTL